MKQRWFLIVAVAAISFFSGGWLLQQGAQQDGGVYRQARLFDDVLSHVQAYYVDSVGESELYRRATDGMLDQLKDPYSVLLTGEGFRQLTETTTGNYGGLGIQIDVRDGWITVVAPLPDTPAERAGLETGDQIVEVNGKSTEGWKNDQAVSALRGVPGTTIKIRIRRAGFAETMPFELVRAEIHIRSVAPGALFPGGIGYVALNSVSETSAQELREEIDGLSAQGMKSLILDLRRNPGGLLEQGVKVADLFLDPRQEIVSTRGRARGSSRRFTDAEPQRWPSMPIVVLVDEGSASAAEIIAGAIQDHDRGLVVGAPTFGKGLVQTLFQLGDSVALKLTTARWYTPSGRTIQRIARTEEQQADLAAAQADTLAPDSTRAVFTTDGGRKVFGGGGITPDVIVRADTLTAPERAFATALGEHLPAYRDALTSYALELKSKKIISSPSFTVTPEMRRAVYARLKEKGATIDEGTFNGAGQLVDEQLGYEVARYVFGRPAEFRRRSMDDPQIRSALEKLRQARTTKELIAAVSAGAPPPINP